MKGPDMPYLVRILVVASLVLATVYTGFSQEVSDIHPILPSRQPDRIVLNVTENISTAMAVTWRTSGEIDSGFAELAVADARPSFVQASERFTAKTQQLEHGSLRANYHSVVFRDLLPGTTYAYRVGQDDNWSEWFHFTTASAQSGDLSLIYFGDVQSNILPFWSRAVRQAFRMVPDARMMLYAGDLVNRANRDIEWGDWFLAGGFIHAMIPSMPTPGNHDHADSEKGDYRISKFWKPQFELPLNGPAGQTELEESCYYTDVQDVRIITLNTELFDTSRNLRRAQLRWLEETLEQNTRKWTLLLIHHPVYSTKRNRDNKELREAIKPLLDRFRVDMVLQGHDHTYVRGMEKVPMPKSQPSGTAYVVSVSGPKMSDVLRADWMDRTAGHIQLFHAIRIREDVLAFDTYTVTGELYDRFELHKVPGKVNKFVDLTPVGVAERQ